MLNLLKGRSKIGSLRFLYLPGVCALAFGFTFAWKYQSQSIPNATTAQQESALKKVKNIASNVTETPDLNALDAIAVETVDTPAASIEAGESFLEEPTTEASLYGELTSDELHEINPEYFSNIVSFGANDIEAQMSNDSAFNDTVMAMVREELARPTHEIGAALTGVESEEITHARNIIDVVLQLEEQGVLVDLDELSYARLGEDLSAGIFGNTKKLERVVSQSDDYGNEHLSMSVLPNENVSTNSFGLDAPVSVSFGAAIVSSSTNPYWSGGKNGRVIGYYTKYKDLDEQDRSKDYYSYSRWSLAEPKKVALPFARDPYSFVRTADLKSGITNGSKWKVFARVDQEPWNKVNSGSANCSNATLGVSLGVVTVESQGQWCDSITPNHVWGGLHTRYAANRSLWSGYGNHAGDRIRNNFMVTMSVKPGTVPYWWDYNDAYFCDTTNRRFDCAEYTQYQ